MVYKVSMGNLLGVDLLQVLTYSDFPRWMIWEVEDVIPGLQLQKPLRSLSRKTM